MTPQPKRKHSSMRQGKRRASIKFSLPNLVLCPNCGKPKLNHIACLVCGFYKGKQVIKSSSNKKSQ